MSESPSLFLPSHLPAAPSGVRGFPAPPDGAIKQEIFAQEGSFGAAASFALGLALMPGPPARAHWLWVQDTASIRAEGRPFIAGLPPCLRAGMIHIVARKPQDALFALEEGLRCRDLAFVLGELEGNPRALDFTASRRLAVASERHGVPLFLVRHQAVPELSAARRRWRVGPMPSAPDPWDARAPGGAEFAADLFRARDVAPGSWRGNFTTGWSRGHDHAAPPPAVDLAAYAGDRPLAANRAG
ncbi:recA-like protein [Qipengyuania sp. YIM B01966]|uniref:recA-like protein n=1 Tax=Qipengyuania sp. YIM B01966 TaxID=2778646 RepID=UPI0018F67F69|nr:recA-like protein [Qipengyuania sp. YIM B01966]